MNVEPTALKIDEMADSALRLSKELGRLAEQMRISKDLNYAADVVTTVVNAVGNFRLDLMVTRPIRELSK